MGDFIGGILVTLFFGSILFLDILSSQHDEIYYAKTHYMNRCVAKYSNYDKCVDGWEREIVRDTTEKPVLDIR